MQMVIIQHLPQSGKDEGNCMIEPNNRQAMLLMSKENESILDQKKQATSQQPEAFSERRVIKIKQTLTKEEKEKLEKVQKKNERSVKLLELISLGNVNFEVVDLPPLSDYELYQRSFAKGASSQTAVQCPPLEDLKEFGVNTVSNQQVSKSIQAPEDLGISTRSTPKNSMEKFKFNSLTLARFLKSVAPVCDKILEANSSNSTGSEQVSKRESSFKFSSSFTAFSCDFTVGRIVKEVIFSKDNQMIVCYGRQSETSEDVEGLVCVWNILNDKIPEV